MKLPTRDISINIGSAEIPLQSRSAAIVALLARHQATVNRAPLTKVIFDCSPGKIEMSIQPELGRVKVRKR